MSDLNKLLKRMNEIGASDMHLAHNVPITYRVDGKILFEPIIIDGDSIWSLGLEVIKPFQVRTFNERLSVDFAYSYGGYRYRGILGNQQGKTDMTIRKIDGTIRPFDETNLPKIIKDICDASWGLFLVTGPTGSGKSTSLASIIDYINETKPLHIVTMEEPLEFLHSHKKSFITQREVGTDTPSFADAMRDVLRQDPDVILVGEMRDFETTSAAITNAGTGHLVFGTLHTNTAAQAIERIMDIYPESLRGDVRGQLATNLRGVLAQRLVAKPGGGRTALYELLIMNPEMKQAIRDNRLHELEDLMKKYRHEGNILMQDSIDRAVKDGTMEGYLKW